MKEARREFLAVDARRGVTWIVEVTARCLRQIRARCASCGAPARGLFFGALVDGAEVDLTYQEDPAAVAHLGGGRLLARLCVRCFARFLLRREERPAIHAAVVRAVMGDEWTKARQGEEWRNDGEPTG